MRKRIVVVMLCIILFLGSVDILRANNDKDLSLDGIKVLWDRAQGWTSRSPTGSYAGLGNALLEKGATIDDLKPGNYYTAELLADYDIVIMAGRRMHSMDSERVALINFLENGGSLLVFSGKDISPMCINPVLVRFGLELGGKGCTTKHFSGFVYPATTDRRPISEIIVYYPRVINLTNGAIPIVGKPASANPSAMFQECFGALGHGGKGRVIAIGDSEFWRSSG